MLKIGLREQILKLHESEKKREQNKTTVSCEHSILFGCLNGSVLS